MSGVQLFWKKYFFSVCVLVRYEEVFSVEMKQFYWIEVGRVLRISLVSTILVVDDGSKWLFSCYGREPKKC
jgi:hypothetical protein